MMAIGRTYVMKKFSTPTMLWLSLFGQMAKGKQTPLTIALVDATLATLYAGPKIQTQTMPMIAFFLVNLSL
jgi:hypothetical protein